MPSWTLSDKISSSKKGINYTESGPHLWFQFMKSLLVPKPATFGSAKLRSWMCGFRLGQLERPRPAPPTAIHGRTESSSQGKAICLRAFTEKQTHVGLFLAGRGAEPAFQEKARYYSVLFSWKPWEPAEALECNPNWSCQSWP